MIFMLFQFLVYFTGAIEIEPKGKGENETGCIDGSGKRSNLLPDLLLIEKEQSLFHNMSKRAGDSKKDKSKTEEKEKGKEED